MCFVENDQIEKARTKFVEAKIHRLLRRYEKAFSRVDIVRVDAIARLVRKMRLEAIG